MKSETQVYQTKFKEPKHTLYGNDEKKKCSQVSDAIDHNVDNLEMILGRSRSYSASPKEFSTLL